MLSFKKGVPIARIDNKIIHLRIYDNIYKYLSKEYKNKIKKLSPKDKKKLLSSLKNNLEPLEHNLKKLFQDGITDLNDPSGFNKLETKRKIQVLPRDDLVEKIYVSGVSGSGKSTYIGHYIKEFKKIFKKDEIFIFSSVNEDKAFDKYNPIRIPIDETLITEPFIITDFEESLSIFDDTDTIRNKEYRNIVNGIKAEIIEIGRHYESRIIVSSHMISNFHQTRQILNECTSITFFPKASGVYHIKNYLKTNAGLDKNQIERVLKLNSRWVTIYRTYPSYIVWERGISIMAEF